MFFTKHCLVARQPCGQISLMRIEVAIKPEIRLTYFIKIFNWNLISFQKVILQQEHSDLFKRNKIYKLATFSSSKWAQKRRSWFSADVKLKREENSEKSRKIDNQKKTKIRQNHSASSLFFKGDQKNDETTSKIDVNDVAYMIAVTQ